MIFFVQISFFKHPCQEIGDHFQSLQRQMMIGHCILIMAFLSDFHVTYKKNEVKKEDGKKFLNAMDS